MLIFIKYLKTIFCSSTQKQVFENMANEPKICISTTYMKPFHQGYQGHFALYLFSLLGCEEKLWTCTRLFFFLFSFYLFMEVVFYNTPTQNKGYLWNLKIKQKIERSKIFLVPITTHCLYLVMIFSFPILHPCYQER